MKFELRGYRAGGEVVSFEIEAAPRDFPNGPVTWEPLKEFKSRELTPLSIKRVEERIIES